MLKKISPFLIALLLQPTLTNADESYISAEPDINDNPSQLKSVALLQSLKNQSNAAADYRAPYVHDLKNSYGVRSLFVEAQDLPMIDIQLTFNAGAARDTEIGNGLGGLANMVAKLLDEGTEKYTAEQVASVFEQAGARFGVQAYRDMFVVTLRVLSDPAKMEPALAMMIELLNNASFKGNSINLMLTNTQAGQKQLQENPSRLMGIQFYRSLYGTHPYAEPISGTNGSIKRLNAENLKKFRDTLLVAQNMNIAITGKMTAKEALSLTERIAGNLRQGKRAGALPEPKQSTGFNLKIKHLPFDSSQSHVTIGHLATTRNDPDRLVLEVANRMFGGGGFNAILMQELRIKRGYTYGAYSSFSFSQSPGLFSFSYSTREDQFMDSIRVAHKAFTDFVNKPIDRKRLEETKAGMLRAYPNTYSSNASINSQLGLFGFYGQPADTLSQYPKMLEKITAEDVQKAVRKHLHPDHLTIVAVSKILDQDELVKLLKQNLGIANTQAPKKALPAQRPATDVPVETLADTPESI